MKAIKTMAIAAAALACQALHAQYPYKVIAPVPVEDGKTVFLVNYDTSEKVDSAIVSDASVVFTGEIDEPYVARLIADGKRLGTFILEQGTTAINQTTRRAVGSMLNDRLNAYADSTARIEDRYDKASSTEERKKILAEYKDYAVQAIEDNLDTALGFYLFMDVSNIMEVDEAMAFIEKHPELKDYKRVRDLIEGAGRKLATSPGHKFVDFEITYDGATKKLSDYVGRGEYVLVDFWASWCGPCMREIETLKEIYKKYDGKGLKVLGVAVWDEPQNTLAAIDRKKIPWECIINAQTIPTDAYGIAGIPCIILFDPDGNIVFRDLQGQELKEAVDAALSK